MCRSTGIGGSARSGIQYCRKDRCMTTIEILLKKCLLLPCCLWATFDTSSEPRRCFGCFPLCLIKKIIVICLYKEKTKIFNILSTSRDSS